MSMNGNPHADKAMVRLHNGTHNEVARAAVEATLALAYEQRTANMIALATMDPAVFGMASRAFFDEIDGRLGIKVTA